jgi:mono/diheme cytochrome c family protein
MRNLRTRRQWFWLPTFWFIAAVLLLSPSQARQQSVSASAALNPVQPFFNRTCYGCHNSSVRSGGLNLETFSGAIASPEDAATVDKILRRIRAGEMPPASRPRPDEAELRLVTNWLESELDRTDALAPGNRNRAVVRRLNRAEYSNTIRDLLGVDMDIANDFPPDDSVHGFDNVAEALSVSPLLMEKYLAAAERISRTAVFGSDVKNLTTTYQKALPRRMETTNLVLVQQPAYYSPTDYDVSGLSHPGSLHIMHHFAADGEYLIRLAGAGYRPKGSEPGEMTFWIDGKLAATLEVPVDVPSTGFEYRPDHWEVRINVTAGKHELLAAFPRQYEGLPAVYGGLNPSKLPAPPLRDEISIESLEAALERETIPERIERRKLEIERAKQQSALPITMRKDTAFPGMSMTQMEVIGPFEYTRGPSQESLKRIYTCGHTNGSHGPACERKIISDLAQRSYRRDVTSGEVAELLRVFSDTRNRGGSFEEGLTVAISAMLVSPDFLFRVEPAMDSARPTSRPTSTAARAYELASRLSYFLWSSMPDDELLRAAEGGKLLHQDVLRAQVRRMLADRKARALSKNFAGQWLEIRRLKNVQPDRERYPDFDDYLRDSMLQETELFFHHILEEDRSLLDFLDASYTFLNERLASHYGIRDVTGTHFRKVDMSSTGRRGILSHASVLTVSSYGNRTSPVLRGKWILENLLNAPPPPPPPNVPSLDESAVGTSASLREQLEQHRKNPTCASCHARMDPLGFGLENYDAVGARRTQDGTFAVDASGTLPNGKKFSGSEELIRILRQDENAFIECLTEKLMIYALGRPLERADRPAIRQIVARAASDNYKFSSVLLGIIESRPFLREAPAATARR